MFRHNPLLWVNFIRYWKKYIIYKGELCMKKIKIILMFLLIFTIIPITGVSAEEGGLLNGKPLTYGSLGSMGTVKATEATDGDLSTVAQVGHSSTPDRRVYYKFDTPTTIDSYSFYGDLYVVLQYKNSGPILGSF